MKNLGQGEEGKRRKKKEGETRCDWWAEEKRNFT
jgi:hypothetical protein